MDTLFVILVTLLIAFMTTALFILCYLFIDEMRERHERRMRRIRDDNAFYDALGVDDRA